MTSPPNPPGLPALPSPPSAGGFWRLLFSGLGAVLLRTPQPGSVSTAAGHCMLLVLLVTLIGIVAERWLLGAMPLTFNWTTLREVWFDLPVLLLGGAWMVQARPTSLTRPMPIFHFAAVMFGASVWIVAIAYAVFAAITLGWLPGGDSDAVVDIIHYGGPVWSFVVAVATIRRMHRFSPIPALRRLAVLVVLAAVTAWYLVVPAEPYWQVPPGEAPELYAARPHG